MWLLILQFILNFPSFISAVIQIWKLIQQILNPDVKAQYEQKLSDILHNCNKAKKATQDDHDALQDLLAELKLNQQTP